MPGATLSPMRRGPLLRSSVLLLLVTASGCSDNSPTVTPTRVSQQQPVSSTQPVAPAPALTATGRWVGAVQVLTCSANGVFTGACGDWRPQQDGSYGSFTLNLIDTGGSLAGDIQVSTFPLMAVRGTQSSGRVVLTARGAISASTDLGYEDWSTAIDAQQMTGEFTMRFFARQNGVTGSAQWRIRLLNVSRR